MTIITGNSFQAEIEFAKYPFVDTATLIDTQKNCQLESSWFYDAKFWPVISRRATYCYIQSIEKKNQQLIITVFSSTGFIGSCTVTNLLRKRFVFYDTMETPVGVLIMNQMGMKRVFDSLTSGIYLFTEEATRFLPHVFSPNLATILTTISDENNQKQFLPIKIVGGEGVHLTANPTTKEIRVDAIGDPVYGSYSCPPENIDRLINPLRRIRIKNEDKEYVVEPKNGSVTFTFVNRNNDADHAYKTFSSDITKPFERII